MPNIEDLNPDRVPVEIKLDGLTLSLCAGPGGRGIATTLEPHEAIEFALELLRRAGNVLGATDRAYTKAMNLCTSNPELN